MAEVAAAAEPCSSGVALGSQERVPSCERPDAVGTRQRCIFPAKAKP